PPDRRSIFAVMKSRAGPLLPDPQAVEGCDGVRASLLCFRIQSFRSGTLLPPYRSSVLVGFPQVGSGRTSCAERFDEIAMVGAHFFDNQGSEFVAQARNHRVDRVHDFG